MSGNRTLHNAVAPGGGNYGPPPPPPNLAQAAYIAWFGSLDAVADAMGLEPLGPGGLYSSQGTGRKVLFAAATVALPVLAVGGLVAAARRVY